MPWLNKLVKKQRSSTDKRALRAKYYNTKKWTNLRAFKLLSNPLCEVCLSNDIITQTVDIHHIVSPFNDGYSNDERMILFLDINNLKSVCKKCHGEIHSSEKNQKY